MHQDGASMRVCCRDGNQRMLDRVDIALAGSVLDWARADPTTPGWAVEVTRARLEQLLSPGLAPACAAWLWADAWELGEVTPWTLWALAGRHGEEIAALAVAAGMSEGEIRRHLEDRRCPDRAVLEMLADLNCFPHVTPAARPLPEERQEGPHHDDTHRTAESHTVQGRTCGDSDRRHWRDSAPDPGRRGAALLRV